MIVDSVKGKKKKETTGRRVGLIPDRMTEGSEERNSLSCLKNWKKAQET